MYKYLFLMILILPRIVLAEPEVIRGQSAIQGTTFYYLDGNYEVNFYDGNRCKVDQFVSEEEWLNPSVELLKRIDTYSISGVPAVYSCVKKSDKNWYSLQALEKSTK